MVPSLVAGAGAWCSACSRLKRQGKRVVRAEGVEPSRAVKLNGFSYRLRLSPPGRRAWKRQRRVCGLDYPFTVPRENPGLRCCPSSLYTFPAGMFLPGLARDCHFRFPRIWAVLHRRFPKRALKFPQVRSVCRSATPAWLVILSYLSHRAAGCNVSLPVAGSDF